MRSCQCPNCNAQISLDENREFGFCQYCGTKIAIDDFRSIHRVVDEARIKETETERIIRLKELELEENENAKLRKSRMIAYGVALIFAIIGSIIVAIDAYNTLGIFIILGGVYIALMTMINTDSQNKKLEDARNARRGMIRLPSDATACTGKNFEAVAEIYTNLGFRYVKTKNLKDLKFSLIRKPGEVDEVMIDGSRPDEKTWYSPNASVVITYHGMAKDK